MIGPAQHPLSTQPSHVLEDIHPSLHSCIYPTPAHIVFPIHFFFTLLGAFKSLARRLSSWGAISFVTFSFCGLLDGLDDLGLWTVHSLAFNYIVTSLLPGATWAYY
jgi:hypothetical protein